MMSEISLASDLKEEGTLLNFVSDAWMMNQRIFSAHFDVTIVSTLVFYQLFLVKSRHSQNKLKSNCYYENVIHPGINALNMSL